MGYCSPVVCVFVLPVYSASSNLVYVLGIGSVTGHLIKHVAIVLIGISIMYATHRIPFKYFSGLSVIALPIVWVLLVYTAARNDRWSKCKSLDQNSIIGLSFQTSTLASVVLMVYGSLPLNQ